MLQNNIELYIELYTASKQQEKIINELKEKIKNEMLAENITECGGVSLIDNVKISVDYKSILKDNNIAVLPQYESIKEYYSLKVNKKAA